MTTDGELWHFVEAKRDDGMPTMFNIRELEPRTSLTTIFVVELPYPKTTPGCLPSAADYQRHAEFDEQWLRPACSALGWELVGSKVEDGSFYSYMYGNGDPNLMVEKLSPYDTSLGFYDDDDPDWQEYGTLRDLLDQAKRIPAEPSAPAAQPMQTVSARARAATSMETPRKSRPRKKPRAKKSSARTPAAPATRKTNKATAAGGKSSAAKRKRR